MADYVTRVRTKYGDKQIDYNALANLPRLYTGANAIKASRSGEIVEINDASPFEHILSCRLASDTVLDFSSTQIYRSGKNLIDLSKAGFNGCIAAGNGVQANIKGGYYIEFALPYLVSFIQNNDGETLTFSVANPVADATITMVIMYTDGTYLAQSSPTKAVSLTINNAGRTVSKILLRPIARSDLFTDTSTVIEDIQLELGANATEFEAPKGIGIYTSNSTGTVDGITSLSPSVTLWADTEGVAIECEYDKDINVVIAELLARIDRSTSYISQIELLSSKWQGTASPYSQAVTLEGISEYSKVDINPSIEQLSIFHNKDIAFIAENDDGVVTVYCIGQKPTDNYTMQVTITEVNANG